MCVCKRECHCNRKWFILYSQLLIAMAFKAKKPKNDATCCSTLQYTATHCSTLQHTATRCNTLQHTADVKKPAIALKAERPLYISKETRDTTTYPD